MNPHKRIRPNRNVSSAPNSRLTSQNLRYPNVMASRRNKTNTISSEPSTTALNDPSAQQTKTKSQNYNAPTLRRHIKLCCKLTFLKQNTKSNLDDRPEICKPPFHCAATTCEIQCNVKKQQRHCRVIINKTNTSRNNMRKHLMHAFDTSQINKTTYQGVLPDDR